MKINVFTSINGVAVKHGTPERGTAEYGITNPEW